jgi:hypothetical protein
MPAGLHEERARVTMFLPVTKAGEFRAYAQIINYLSTQPQSLLPPTARITGFTYTSVFPSPYRGYWRDQSSDPWQREETATIIIDLNLSLSDQNHIPILNMVLENLRDFCLQSYQIEGHPQQTIWIVVYRIQRFI